MIEAPVQPMKSTWKHARLKDVAEKPQYGVTASAAPNGPVKFLRITDITDHGVNWESVPYCNAPAHVINACMLRSGDIVFARIGATTGKSYLISEPPPAVFASYLIRVRTGNDLDPEFLSHYFKSDGYWDQVNANKHANLKKGVNGSILSELEVPVPPLNEQRSIAHVLNTVQEAIAQQERLIRTTTELKQALMHRLFTEGLRGEKQKETEIGLVPESWEVVRLEEFCQRPDGLIQTGPFGSQLHSHEYASEGIPVVNPTHLVGNRINHEDVPHVPKEVADRLGRHYVQLSDILFARRGEIGRHGLVGQAEIGWLCGTGCFLVRANHPRLNNEYLSYYCSSKPVVDWLNSYAAGAIMPNLSTSVIANLPVGLPPLDEQCQIVETFNAIDQKLDQADHKRRTLQDLFRSLLYELMTGKVRVNKFEHEHD